jgi:acetyl esterase/lipase
LTLGTARDKSNPNAKDPADRVSSRVQAVACFFLPTDFLNYGEASDGKIHATDHAPPYGPAFDHRELNKESRLWVPITDPKQLEEITRQISPVYHVTTDDPPTLIIHGDKDPLVPLQQSEMMIDKLKKAGVKAILVIKKGAGHGLARAE